MQRGPKRFSA